MKLAAMFAINSHRSTTEKEAVKATAAAARRELAHRVDDDIEVALLWDERADTIALRVHDRSLDEHVELEVPRDRALDAFHRPDAYVAAAKATAPTRRRRPRLTRPKRRETAAREETTTVASGRELASRHNDGLEIVLLWHPRENEVTVSVADSRSGDRIEFFVDREHALDAFHHPFVYAP